MPFRRLKGFKALVKEVGLKSPFKEGTIKSTIEPLLKFLNTIDDSKL